ncbi:P27 family phage terminase small subunit, partial [Streptococcus suis]
SLGFKKNPAVATMKDAVDTLNKIGIQLGLTPKGGQELLAIVGEDKDDKSAGDALKDFFGGAE